MASLVFTVSTKLLGPMAPFPSGGVRLLCEVPCQLGPMIGAATLDGGISGGRAYLAAYAQRFGATGLTFFDDDAARFFGLDPRRFGVMFLTAVGQPAQRSSR